MRKLSIMLGGAALASSLFAAMPGASASTLDGGGQVGMCQVTVHDIHKSDATHLRATFTMTCTGMRWVIGVGGTISPAHGQTKTCSTQKSQKSSISCDVEVPDPAGSQQYTFLADGNADNVILDKDARVMRW